jgi:hypothetical protein
MCVSVCLSVCVMHACSQHVANTHTETCCQVKSPPPPPPPQQALVSRAQPTPSGAARLLVEELPGLDAKALQEAAAALLEQLGDPAAVLLASRGEGDSAGRISFAAASSPQVRLKLAFEAASPALSLTEDCF